jgi:hypothetical protein
MLFGYFQLKVVRSFGYLKLILTDIISSRSFKHDLKLRILAYTQKSSCVCKVPSVLKNQWFHLSERSIRILGYMFML